MKEKIKNLSTTFIGIAIFIGVILLIFILIYGGLWLSKTLYPWLVLISEITFIVGLLILLPLGIFKKTKVPPATDSGGVGTQLAKITDLGATEKHLNRRRHHASSNGGVQRCERGREKGANDRDRMPPGDQYPQRRQPAIDQHPVQHQLPTHVRAARETDRETGQHQRHNQPGNIFYPPSASGHPVQSFNSLIRL